MDERSHGEDSILLPEEPAPPSRVPLSRRDRALALLMIVAGFFLLTRPWLADLSVWRGETYLHDREFRQAYKHLDRGLLIAPKHAQVNFTYGQSLATGKRLKDAERYLRVAVKSDPGNWEAFYWLGLALSRQGRNAEAVPFLARSVRAGANQPYVAKMLAEARSRAASETAAARGGEAR